MTHMLQVCTIASRSRNKIDGFRLPMVSLLFPLCDLRAKNPFCISSVPCDWHRFFVLRRACCQLTTHRSCGANAGLRRCATVRHPIMSRASSSRSPSTPCQGKAGKHDGASDANIRNFAPVARIMKTALPDNAKIAKEAKECMQECVSEFISFITSEGKVYCIMSRVFTKASCSVGKMPPGEAQDSQRGGHSLRDDFAWI